MHENENSPLTELLSRDGHSREFFCSLSPELRKSLMKRDVGTFETLRDCADNYQCGDNVEEIYSSLNSACSANDCTGLIPAGSDKTADSFEEFKEIYPFLNPPRT